MKKILIIDDEAMLRRAIGDYFEDIDFEVFLAKDGVEGVEKFHHHEPEVVLLDLDMPKMNGFEVLKVLQKEKPEIPVIVISGIGIVGDAVRSLRLGAWDFISKPIADLEILSYTINKAFERADLIKENLEYKRSLEEKVNLRTVQLKELNNSLEKTQLKIVKILARAGEYKDNETGKHIVRISKYTEIIARSMGLTTDRVELIARTSSLHDIGKIGVSDSVLLKPGQLNEAEWQEMKDHCQYGFDILTVRSEVSDSIKDLLEYIHELGNNNQQTERLLSHASNIALFHHERWDGTGYPIGLKGENIPIEARITALADVYDALGCNRPYKSDFPEEKCQALIREISGTHLDPKVVMAFFESIEEINNIKQQWMD